MKPEEVRALLTRIVENRENQALVTELATQLGDAYEATHTNAAGFETQLQESQTKIKDLEKTNMNLYLRVQQPHDPKTLQNMSEGNTEDLTFDKLLSDWEV